MAFSFSFSFSFATLFFFLLILTTVTPSPTTTTTLIHRELDTTLRTLSLHGYTLFSNAITTSDIKFHLLSNPHATNFTLFAPKDAHVFDLDMTLDAIDYVSALKYHVIPNHRLTFADLISLASPFLDTLLPHYSLLVGKIRDENVTGENGVGLLVDGARVTDPDLFVGTSFVVHGIDGILSTGLNIRHQGFEQWLGSGDRVSQPPAVSPAPVSVGLGIAPTPQVDLDVGVSAPAPPPQVFGNVSVGDPEVVSAPIAASVGTRVNETMPVGANVGNRVNETTPIDDNNGIRANETTPIGSNASNPVNETTSIGANVGNPVNETRRKMPIGSNVGNHGKGKRRKMPIGSNIGNVPAGKGTRQKTSAVADKLKKKVHRVNRGRGHGHGHKRHRQQLQQPRNPDL